MQFGRYVQGILWIAGRFVQACEHFVRMQVAAQLTGCVGGEALTEVGFYSGFMA
jgi:hypothetical protein